MWNGKRKAITFSFDDGVHQDAKVIEILDKYNLKATFNINSGLLGRRGSMDRNGHTVRYDKFDPDKLKNVYLDHGMEVAGHTLSHPNLIDLDDRGVIYQVEQDRKLLESILGITLYGLAYPGGGVNYSHHIEELIRQYTPYKYARTTECCNSFDLQSDLLCFKPNVYYIDVEKLFSMGRSFLDIESNSDKPQLLYIWGHAYELDAEYITYKKFDEFCSMISNIPDIFYGTNAQVFNLE